MYRTLICVFLATTIVETMQQEAVQVRPLVQSDLAQRFLDATGNLRAAPTRTVYRDEETRAYLSARAAAALPEDERAALKKIDLSRERYYTTKYGSPIAYTRAIDLVARAGFDTAEGRRILDYGYGTVGHLRLLGACGGDVVGVDVDSFLSALYSEQEDQGVVDNPGGPDGRLLLVEARWPASDDAISAVGDGYDLFISKNTLKRGYIHPSRDANPRMLIDLGVDDETYCRQLWRMLNPGGYAIIYNICPAPAPADKPYIPWADGRCPFARGLLERIGFEVIAYDVADDEAVRIQAHALGWDQGERPMDLEKDLFAHYTILRKPGE